MNYAKKTIKELVVLCKEKCVKGYSGRNKEQLIQLLTAAEKPVVAPPPFAIPTINPDIFKKHEEKVQCCKQRIETTEGYDKEIYQEWLEGISSKTGNDIHEKNLVRATGREPKSNSQKHGADSEDGLLEAKPCKGKYSAHISDDTPMSLHRHQQIPYCIIGVSTEDGSLMQYAVSCSYRIFDNSRYTEIKKVLGITDLPDELPSDIEERNTLLQKLIGLYKKKHYVRSNPLPLPCLKGLPTTDYDVYIHSSILAKSTHTAEEKIIVDLWKAKYNT